MEMSVSRKDMYPARNGLLPKESPLGMLSSNIHLGPQDGLRMNELRVWGAIKVSPISCLEEQLCRSCSQNCLYSQAFPRKHHESSENSSSAAHQDMQRGQLKVRSRHLGQSHLLFLAVGFGNFLCERYQDWETMKDQNAKLLITLLRYKLHR